jgi:hypothetical protein
MKHSANNSAPFVRTIGIGLALAAALIVAAGTPAVAQNGGKFYDQPAYDQITLDAANDNAVIKVEPIPFPGRKVPEKPKSSDKLTVKLLENAEDYEVAWRNIVKVELFEQLIINEMLRLTIEGNLDEAYDYLVHLRANYPNAPGLDAAHQTFLYQSAGAAFKNANYAEALGLIEELHSRNATYQASSGGPTLLQVLGSAADKLIDQYVTREDYRSARTLLERLTAQYQATDEPFAVKWRTNLADKASDRRDAAREALNSGDYVSAYDAVAEMREIWPAVQGGAELLSEMSRRYPRVQVGVLAPALRPDVRSIADPAARRAGRLVERQLFEYLRMGPEGGEYLCPYGETELSDNLRELTFRLRPSEQQLAGAVSQETPVLAAPMTGYRLSRALMPSTDRGADPLANLLRRIVETVSVQNVWQVDVRFRSTQILPQAMLQDALQSESREAPSGPFVAMNANDKGSRFITNERYPLRTSGQLAELVERVYEDPQRALLALDRGEVDMLDRVFPGDVANLRRNRSLAVEPLGVPTTHMIVVRHHNPYLANRTFRRALVYGSDREAILGQILLRGSTLPGYKVISAPFPAPTDSSDTVAYGYDERIAPRPFEPRLGLTLRMLGQREVKALFEKQQKDVPKLAPLKLAHPADDVARMSCRALVAQWKAIGVPVELVELPVGVFVDEGAKHDMLYVQASTVEPLVDAARLFGEGGLAPSDNSFIRLAVRQLDAASSWREARQRLQELHRLVHEEVAVLPLWQTYDYFAYRRSLLGVGKQPASLYETVEQWRLSPQTAGN